MSMPTSIKLNDDLKERLQQFAESRQRPAHWIMREAIQQYVVREERRESFKQDALRAWTEYQHTGQHITLDEADAWLAKLEAGANAELPECHA